MSKPCVRSGYCCKVAPCPFGEWDAERKQCTHLIGNTPGSYACGIYDYIIKQPGAEVSPAFGAGCCSPLNSDRKGIE